METLRLPMRQRLVTVLPVLTLAVTLLLLSGCSRLLGRAAPTPTPTPTPTRRAAAGVVRPTFTPTPRRATPTPTTTPTAVPAADEPTTVPVGIWILPPPFGPVPDVPALPPLPPRPANVNPITGLEVADPAILQRRPIMVCINNSAISGVRPQYGLSQADVVYEYLVEGGITRYTALFWSQEVERIGPVRSARLINAEIPAQYQAFLACSGASGEVNWILKNKAQFPYMNADLDDPGNNRYFFTVGNYYETRMQASTAGLRLWLAEKGLDTVPTLRGFAFAEDAPAGGQPAAHLNIPFLGGYQAAWAYDFASGRYLRYLAGGPHVEAATGAQLAFENVVVQFVTYTTTDIIEDALGSRGLLPETWGEGQALVLRDGQAYGAIWRSMPDRNTAYLSPDDGAPIAFKPGRTWFVLVPVDFDVTWQ